MGNKKTATKKRREVSLGELHFAEPESIDAAEKRRLKLIADISDLQRSLGSKEPGGVSNYFSWRKATVTDLNTANAELRFVKAWISNKTRLGTYKLLRRAADALDRMRRKIGEPFYLDLEQEIKEFLEHQM